MEREKIRLAVVEGETHGVEGRGKKIKKKKTGTLWREGRKDEEERQNTLETRGVTSKGERQPVRNRGREGRGRKTRSK